MLNLMEYMAWVMSGELSWWRLGMILYFSITKFLVLVFR